MSVREQPSDAAILQKLQDVVISLHRAGNTYDLTVKRVRTRAEQALGLPDGLLKGADWKKKSKYAIEEAVDKYCGDEPEPEPAKPTLKSSKPKVPAEKTEPKVQSKQGAKRKAAAPKKQPQKRRKTASSEDEPSDAESEPAKKTARRTSKVVHEDPDEEDEAPKTSTKKTKPVIENEDGSDAECAITPAKKAKNSPPALNGDVSESELSSLLDESPAKNKRQKKVPAAKTKEPAKPKVKPTPKAADDPDTAEIKRLQSWLVKCGIRKVWSKELAKFDTSKDKIRHLKGMLSDAGMDGRFSDEKAAKIKEKREFEKDLEAIKEGEASWGTAEDTGGRPRRRAAARPVPVQKIEFSDDDEESEENKDDGVEPSEDDQDDVDEGDGHSASGDDDGNDSGDNDSE